jgi:hypothetical protein
VAGVWRPGIREEEAAPAAGYGGRNLGRPRDTWMVADLAGEELVVAVLAREKLVVAAFGGGGGRGGR